MKNNNKLDRLKNQIINTPNSTIRITIDNAQREARKVKESFRNENADNAKGCKKTNWVSFTF